MACNISNNTCWGCSSRICGCGCRSNCGCWSHCCCPRPPFPPLPPMPPTPNTFSGTVYGTNGFPVSGINISYTIDGVSYTTTSDLNGAYSFTVPGSGNNPAPVITITANPSLGVNVVPPSYTLTGGCSSISGLDFHLVPVNV